MKLRARINEHRHIDVTAITEHEENSLLLRVEEARADRPADDVTINGHTVADLTAIETTDSCAAYEIQFDNYISYAVRNESYVSADDYEQHDARLFCIYTRSRFLDFVKSSTFATDDYPGAFVHYGFHCLNHIIDVAACDPPSIVVARGG